MRLEYKSESSNKFWEPKQEEATVTVLFGKTGTDGQTHTKKFPSSEKAESEYRKLICEKLAKGYKPRGETVAELSRDVTLAETQMAIDSVYIGEHVSDDVIRDICGWATACIRHGMTPKQFKSVWNKFLDVDDEFAEVLGRIHIHVGDKTREVFWLDETEWCEGNLYDLYAKAVENGGDKFVWFDNNSYIDIVALRGNPGARAIEICVLQEKNCKNDQGQWLNSWPAELDPGAPIVSMSCYEATLRDGRKYSGIE